jgi:hypothetical protein
MRALADEYNVKLKQRFGFESVPLAAADSAGLGLDLRC